MDFIPAFYFITSLVIFGLLMYVFNPIIDYLQVMFSVSGPWAEAMMFFWSLLALINLFGSGIKFIMNMQKKSRY